MEKINYKLIVKIELSILAVCAVVALYQFVQYVPGVKDAIALATTVKPETFTELYFEDHTNLPQTITRWQTYTFTFTTHNLEYRDTTYPYEIYIERGDQKIPIDQGTFTLPHDSYKSTPITIGPLKTTRSKIVINLIEKNQQIAFWMDTQ